MTAETITGSLAGAQFVFRCDAPDLCDYARVHLAPLQSLSANTPTVTSTVRWHDSQPPHEAPLPSSELPLERVDRDVYASAAGLWWFRVDDLRDLYLQFSWKDDRLAVEGDFYYRLGNSWRTDHIRRLRHGRGASICRQRRFTTLLYYLVYYPCWWWLEQTQDLHPIHAAGVRTDSDVVLLAGASGVGKSTLAVALASVPGAQAAVGQLRAAQRASRSFAVREPVLLDAWSRRWLGDRRPAICSRIDWRYCLNRRWLSAAAGAPGGRRATQPVAVPAARAGTLTCGASQRSKRISV